MQSYVLIGNVLQRTGVKKDWLLAVEDDIIVLCEPLSSPKALEYLNSVPNDKVYNFDRKLLAPAFVDIHCHAGGGCFTHEDPITVMKHHRSHGTGAMLMTLYRNLGHEGLMKGTALIKEKMAEDKGILGVHLEGPYLNPNLGCGFSDTPLGTTIEAEYRELLATGVIKMWTFAPEVPGTPEFCREITEAGVVGAMGHSAATYPQVHEAAKAGASVVTHVFNATATTNKPFDFIGTKNLSFDDACLLEDGLFYELINDREGIHVRHDMTRLLVKIVGKDRVVAITDCYGTGSEEDGDVNFENDQIAGSRMTMDSVARNFLNMGYSLADVFAFTAYNPACALHMEDTIGELAVGKRANILVTDEKLSSLHIFDLER